ncbi:SDR family oxidoreductase [Actinomycetospora corticicola]|uniref:3-oxoacyl-[acyl-carrier protein] reductase n=1 Tax=Actinomycetospora corticicola TaxID=663602 RepID=A0A7Y9DSB4_9PSEU|nr:SDR family NAD(P)-dependent oxidoreductase [Actinomycetospora corticicola]NYD34636.1 3-oxoacyl-[acyl-carrier protein] reductase [Actinomycetospora corticicola]
MDLTDRTVLVTGAGSGIGAGIAAAVLASGGNVVGLEIDADHIEATDTALDAGKRIAWSHGSVAVASDVDAAFDLAEDRFGGVDHLVNNAGLASLSLVVDMSEDDWDLVVDTCLKGTFLCTRAYARRAIATGRPGGIVNIASLNAVAATDGLGHYCAAKAGIKQFTEVCAGELGRHGIRVNSIGPGTVNTPLGAGFTVGQIGQEFLDRTLIAPPRHQEASDVADVALFLLSPEAGRITGHFVPVDGGQHVRGLHSYWDVAEAQGLVARPV